MGDFFGAVTPHQRELLQEAEEAGFEVPAEAVSIADVEEFEEITGTVIPETSDVQSLEFLGTSLNRPVTLAYGRHLVAGAPIFSHKREAIDSNTIMFIALGQGEWDSAEVVWINGKSINIADTNLFHFHPGFDGATGVESAPATPNQQICSFFPAGFTGLTFSKTAYIALNIPLDPLAPGPGFDIRGIYKTRKVRIFDSSGNQTSYAFSLNPAWQVLDAHISLILKPHGLADEALTAAEKLRINFSAFKTEADYCDVDIGGGKKRFEASVAFVQRTNLKAIFDTLLANCQGFLQENDGKLGLFIDKARSSVFTFDQENIKAATFSAPAKSIRSLANRLVLKLRDIESGGGTAAEDFAPWTRQLDDEVHQDFVTRIIKKEMDLGANTKERAERLGNYWLNRSLKLVERGAWIATGDAAAIVPGDRVLGPAKTDHSTQRDWEVLQATDNPDGTRTFQLQEYNESIFSTSVTQISPPSPSPAMKSD